MNEIQRTEHTIEQEKKNLVLQQALTRLASNKDFKLIVLEGFIEKNASRAIRNSVSESFDGQARKDLVATAQASGYLQEYFTEIERKGNMAQRTISDNESFLIQLRQQEQMGE